MTPKELDELDYAAYVIKNIGRVNADSYSTFVRLVPAVVRHVWALKKQIERLESKLARTEMDLDAERYED